MAKNFHIHLRGEVGYWDFSSEQVNYILDKHSSEEVKVLINSLGGFTHEACTISALFKTHGNVTVHYIGFNASAATIASMGAKRVTMDIDALYLVHCCSFLIMDFDYLNADEIAKRIEDLTKKKDEAAVLDLNVAAMYARRCKKSQQELLKLMKEERWLTAQEALEWGFIDEITNDSEDKTDLPDKKKAKAMCEAGLPKPPRVSEESFMSFLERVLGKFRYESDTNKKTSQMEGIELTMKVLGVSEVKSVDGKCEITEAQLSAIESRLKEAEDIKKENKDLKDQISDLSKKTPEEKKEVKESSAESAVSSYMKSVEDAKNMYNLLS